MTRAQKAIAAFGSVLAVTLLYLWLWSVPMGLLVLVVGGGATVATLRMTHPRTGRHFR